MSTNSGPGYQTVTKARYLGRRRPGRIPSWYAEPPNVGRPGRPPLATCSVGAARQHADPGLRGDRRHEDVRAGQPRRVGRLALPSPVRLAVLVHRAARHSAARPLADRPGRGGPVDAPLRRGHVRPRDHARDRLRRRAGHRRHAHGRRPRRHRADGGGRQGHRADAARVGGPVLLRQDHPLGQPPPRPGRSGRQGHHRRRRPRHARPARNPPPPRPRRQARRRVRRGGGRPARVLDDVGAIAPADSRAARQRGHRRDDPRGVAGVGGPVRVRRGRTATSSSGRCSCCGC